VHYFSVWPGTESAFPVTTAFQAPEYGLPFSRLRPDASGTRFLSREEQDCDGAGGGCVLLRSSFVRYERDGTSAECPQPLRGDCYNENRRQAAERTVFHDDGGRYAETERTGWDGLGHYRTETTGGDFGAGDVRTVSTDWNPAGAPAATAPWVLTTYGEQRVSEGGATAKVETCFEAATGFLARRRIYKNFGTSPTGADVVVVYGRDGAGNVTREEWFGGDGAGLGTAALCGLVLPAPRYRLDHTYQAGVLATTRWVDAAGSPLSFFAVDRTIDAATGLVASATDPAGLTTSFEHDALGRLVWEKPPAGHGGWTEYVWSRAQSAADLAGVLVRRRADGSETAPVLAEEQVKFDALGRVWREEEKLPGGAWTAVENRYDGMGHRAMVSEVQTGTPTKWTEFLDYDPFGRPRTIRPADGTGHDVTLAYAGARAVTRQLRVGTTYNPATDTVTKTTVSTTEELDRQGRLWKVTEPAGPAGELVTTRYSYDVGGKLERVCSNPSQGVCGQERVFHHDGRGFLTSERHPEKGAAGNGVVTYSDFDPRGHAGRAVDGASDLTFSFDRAERLTQVRETGGAQRPLERYAYGTASPGGDWKNGKLEVAERFHYVTLGTAPFTVELEETYTYAGRDGRPSKRDTRLWTNGVNTDRFTQTFAYEPLGRVSSLGYPQCTHCPAPAPRTVSPSYTQGRLTAVPGWASAVSYHANGQVHQVTHANGVVDTYAQDPDAMARPRAVTAARGGTTLWATGNHLFDGAGNVIRIGPSWFEYWKASRLKTAAQLDGPTGGGTQKKQSYTFDAYGNLQSITTQVGAATPVVRNTPTSATTNRLTGAASYDASGSLTGWNGAVYQYDPFQQMQRMTNGAEDWLFFYTAQGERAWSFKVGGNLSRWTLRDLGGRVLREYTVSGGVWTVERDYVHRDGTPLAAATPAGARHFSVDHLDTVRLVTDAAGNPVAYHLYHPFGEEATSPTQDAERVKFTGHERDLFAQTGANPAADDLDYMHARHASPLLGRFTSTDTAPANPKMPQSWNRYSYVRNNPLSLVDPDGENPFVVAVVVGVAAAILLSPDNANAPAPGDEILGNEDSTGRMILAAGKGAALGLVIGTAVEAIGLSDDGVGETGTGQPEPKAGSAEAKGSGMRFSEKTKEAAREEARGQCVFCGADTDRDPGPNQSQTDHAIPRSRGGDNSFKNAQNTCRTCNLAKGKRTTEEFLRQDERRRPKGRPGS
jgi:RHS repeat-associated protein